MSKQAIIVIDIQCEYFAAGKLPLVGIEAAAANAARVIAAARKSGEPVIHIQHEMNNPDVPVFLPGSPGTQIHPSGQPAQGEPVITKNYANAFRDTQLRKVLDEKGIDSLVLVGAMTHNCVDATARAAFDFGYPITVIHDACATLDLESNGVKVPANHVHAAFMAALTLYGKVIGTNAYLSS